MLLGNGVAQGSTLSPTVLFIATNNVFLALPCPLLLSRHSLFANGKPVLLYTGHRKMIIEYFQPYKGLRRLCWEVLKMGHFYLSLKSALVLFKRRPIPSLTHSPKIKTLKFLITNSFGSLDSYNIFKTHDENIWTPCVCFFRGTSNSLPNNNYLFIINTFNVILRTLH